MLGIVYAEVSLLWVEVFTWSFWASTFIESSNFYIYRLLLPNNSKGLYEILNWFEQSLFFAILSIFLDLIGFKKDSSELKIPPELLEELKGVEGWDLEYEKLMRVGCLIGEDSTFLS